MPVYMLTWAVIIVTCLLLQPPVQCLSHVRHMSSGRLRRYQGGTRSLTRVRVVGTTCWRRCPSWSSGNALPPPSSATGYGATFFISTLRAPTTLVKHCRGTNNPGHYGALPLSCQHLQPSSLCCAACHMCAVRHPMFACVYGLWVSAACLFLWLLASCVSSLWIDPASASSSALFVFLCSS